MLKRPTTLLRNAIVRAALQQAWQDSNPGTSTGHEEGGFIVQDAKRKLDIVRWPQGAQNSILVVPHHNCKISGKDIVASFHTHPNTGSDFLQEPSETDKRAVCDDPDLKGSVYIGEFVITQAMIYLVTPNGRVRTIANPQAFFVER